MPVEVTLPDDDTIQMKELRDGQLAVITRWAAWPNNVGRIVQRVGAHLVCVGCKGEQSWLEMFNGDDFTSAVFRVRVLPEGASLTVRDNE